MKETTLQCKHTEGTPLFGYDVAPNKTYKINEHEASCVRLIFELYSSGIGYKQMVSIIKSKGYKSKTGKDFIPSSLHDILVNEKYIGTYIFNRSGAKVNVKRMDHIKKVKMK